MTRRRSRTRRSRSSARSRRPIRRTMCAASTTATRRSTASQQDSTTETYAALRLDIENWRWAGRAVLHPDGQAAAGDADRAAPRLPASTAARLRASTASSSRTSSSSSSTRRPGSGSSSKRTARIKAGAGTIELDVEFALAGRGGADTVRGAPARSARSETARASRARTASRRRGGSCSRCSTHRRPCTRTHPGRGGRMRRSPSSPGTAAGTGRGSRHEHDDRRTATSRRAQPRRRRSRRSRTTRSSRTATRPR